MAAVEIESQRVERLHEDCYFVKSMFNLGEGQTEGLRYEGLRERVLSCLGSDPLAHRCLARHDEQESTDEELEEEKAMVKKLQTGSPCPLPLDTTCAVIRRYEGDKALVTLISPIKMSPKVLAEVRELGTVSDIVVPSLQHW